MTAPLSRRSLLVACAAASLAGCSDDESVAVPARPVVGDASPRPVRPSGGVASPRPVRPSGGVLSPLHLSIPSIGVSTRLVRLGLNEDGTVEVPTVAADAGWFRLGTVPGRRGSSVILGHVDSVDGPAVFASLSTMRRSDRVEVLMSDDRLVTFEVTGVETYANADFPAERVYAGTRRGRELNLVTCGGEYDRSRGGYQSNVVVFTRRTRA